MDNYYIITAYFIGGIILAGFFAYAVQEDVKNQGLSYGESSFWAVGVLLLPVIVLPIYLIVRFTRTGSQKQQENRESCSNCGKPVLIEAKLCHYCRKEINHISMNKEIISQEILNK